MQESHGFTLIEVLIAVVIVAMMTVTIGYFATGITRNHEKTTIINKAVRYIDSVLELTDLYHTSDHPEIRKIIQNASRDSISIRIAQTETPLSCSARKVTVIAEHGQSDLLLEISRLVYLDSDPGTP